MRREWMWISAVGLGACSSDWVERDAAVVPDTTLGRWVRCCGLESTPFVRTRGTGGSLECFCDALSTCNWEQTCWERDAWLEDIDAAHDVDAGPVDDADSDAPIIEDAGFAEAGPIDDAAMDALITDDAWSMP